MIFRRRKLPIPCPVTYAGYALLPVRKVGGLRAWAKVDPEDYHRAMRAHWRISPFGYVVTHTTRDKRCPSCSLASFVTSNVPDVYHFAGTHIYHLYRNGNPLDCRKCNLIAEDGVRVHPQGGYFAKIMIGDRKQWLGRFASRQQTARMYALAAEWVRCAIEPPSSVDGERLRRLLNGLCSDIRSRKVVKPDARTGRGKCRFARVRSLPSKSPSPTDRRGAGNPREAFRTSENGIYKRPSARSEGYRNQVAP